MDRVGHFVVLDAVLDAWQLQFFAVLLKVSRHKERQTGQSHARSGHPCTSCGLRIQQTDMEHGGICASDTFFETSWKAIPFMDQQAQAILLE